MIIFDKSRAIFYSTKINSDSFFAGFGTKKTDIDALFDKEKAIIRPRQIHSDSIHHIDDAEVTPTGDGIITYKKNFILTVQTADCVPIIFADKKKKIIGISHQGWKGTLERLSQKIVKAFVQDGSNLTDIVVAIGPAIGDCCYNIDPDRVGLFAQEFPELKDQILRKSGDKNYLNLTALNYFQLIATGVTSDKIDFFPFCTSCNADQFYSFRRDGTAKKEMISFVTLQ